MTDNHNTFLFILLSVFFMAIAWAGSQQSGLGKCLEEHSVDTCYYTMR